MVAFGRGVGASEFVLGTLLRGCDDDEVGSPGTPPAATDVLTLLADQLERFAGRGAPGLVPVIAGLRIPDEATGGLDDEVRYRRLCDALVQMRCEALRSGHEELFDWSHGDAATLLRMTAAVAVVEAAGLPVDRGDDRDAHRRRATHWRRYGRGRVVPLHRSCSADIVRGSLRLLEEARGRPSSRQTGGAAARRAAVHQSRLRLVQWVRGECSDAAGRWRTDAASVPRRGAADFEARVRAAATALIDDVDDRVKRNARALAGPHAHFDGAGAPAVRLPAPVSTSRRVENQLTGVLGAGFGLGAGLASGRLLAEVAGGPISAGVLGGALMGVIVTVWLIAVRNLLHTRAVLDRWAVDVAAAVRSHCEAVVASRLLTVEVALMTAAGGRGSPARGVTDTNEKE
ncbi:hypothetical protein [Mycolicibacterium lacusdiani]|uniref:hypothetical protein n=1 Tax=Mycolicibacterium lacusdiani TaxID=2895283 RepID=UPI001F476486|nr:hypothetical protein [Mycolicibacterium lacusdiani]